MIKVVMLIMVGQLSTLLFLDFGLGAQISRDYGSIEIISFSVVMLFFADMCRRALNIH